MGENNKLSAVSAILIRLMLLLLMAGLYALPAFAEERTITSSVYYDVSAPQFKNGDTVTFSINGQIKIAAEQNVTIEDCTFILNSQWRGFRVEGGTLNLKNCTFKDGKNGAINNDGGTVTISGGEFTNNSAPKGGAILMERGGKLTITGGTKFTNNKSTENLNNPTDGSGGGAINARNANIIIEEAEFINNTAVNYGGAILQNGGTLTLGIYNNDPDAMYNSASDEGKVIFIGNSVTNTKKYDDGRIFATRGGAIAVEVDCSDNACNESGIKEMTLTVNNAKFANNSATFQAGAISLGYSGLGDKVANHAKDPDMIIHVHAVIHLAEFTNNIVSANDRYNVAGGAIVINSDAELTMEDATFVNNTAANAGGAIASCMWGSNNVNIPAGAAIFGNTAKNPRATNQYADDYGNYTDKMDIYVMAYNDEVHPSSIRDETHLGGSHEWSILTNGINYNHKDCNGTCHGAFYGFNGDSSSMDKTKHKVLFEGNKANADMNNNYEQYGKGNGGAIGNNGKLTIRTSQRLNITKIWQDDKTENRPAVPDYLANWLKLTRSGEVFTLGSSNEITKFYCDSRASQNSPEVCYYQTANPAALETEPSLMIRVSEDPGGNWKITIYGLKAYEQNENKNWESVEWDIQENIPENSSYINLNSQNSENTYTFTNAWNLTEISGNKTWKSDENTTRPNLFKVHLHKVTKDGSNCLKDVYEKEIRVTAENPGSWTFENLPLYEADGTLITYEVHESHDDASLNNYLSERKTDGRQYNITNTYAPAKTSLEVFKRWENDGHNRDNSRPESVTVKLYKNNVETDEKCELKAENNWKCEFNDLNKYENNNSTPINYSVLEVSVPNYSVSYNQISSRQTSITNTYQKKPETVTLSVTKTWDDEDNKYNTRPDTDDEMLAFLRSIHLYAGQERHELTVEGSGTSFTGTDSAGEKYEITVERDDTNNTWIVSCAGLPKNDIATHQPIDWRLKEGHWGGYTPLDVPVDGLEALNKDTDTYPYAVTNSLNEMSVTIIKYWDDHNDSNRPGEKEFLNSLELYNNGEFYDHGDFIQKSDHVWGITAHPKVEVTFAGSDSDTWKITIDHLPKRQGDEETHWSAKETMRGYQMSVIYDETTKIFTITNTKTGGDHPFPQFFPLEELPKTGFSALRPTALAEKPLKLNYAASGLTLQIPVLDVMTNIVTVPYTDGEYPVEWLGNAAGMLEGFANPGEGFTVLTGHNHLNTTEAGPFALLSALDKGDMIFVTDAGNALRSFKVYASEKIAAADSAAVESIAKRYDGSLTLLTCEDESPEGGYASRRVIAAYPIH